ncbi:MAG: hypothetical protein KDJ34_02370 [Candidatus Competibacteraceae bacterium]|nr:hypothetical protein [Candidatus Competibacteraceae bacterium]MCP5132099.1 hypothetical protein [Gammaproteobacteria bacterium]
MSDHADFPTLLEEIFHGDSRQLRHLLQSLTAEQRRALFGEFKDLLNVLKRACRFRADAKGVSLSELYHAIRDDPTAFLRERADILAAQGALNNAQLIRQLFYTQLMEFYNRLQLLQAGLAGKGSTASVFRYSAQYPVWCTQFILHAGRVLLDRPEPWVRDTLTHVFAGLENRTRFTGADLGVARLLQEARQRHPDWAEALAPHLGRAMRRDGFFSRTLNGYDAGMILAGLEYDPPSGTMASFEPLMDPKVAESLFTRMADGRLARADLIALTLRKLQGPLQPGVAKTWIEFQQRLALSDTEIRGQAEAFINLLNAPAPAVSKRALAVIEKYFLTDTCQGEELISALGYLLQNPVQVLAKSSLRLLKKLVKSNPGLTGRALNAAIAGLSNPHAALRHELARWFGAFPLSSFGGEALQRLQEAAIALPVVEQASLTALLTVANNEQPAMLDATPLDYRADLDARLALLQQRIKEQPNNGLLRQRLAVLEGYLATGQCPPLEPAVAGHASALSAPDFALHETAEALAADVVRTQRRVFTQADYDRILAGMAHFTPSDHDTGRIRAILAPLLSRLDHWRQTAISEAGSGPSGELAGLILAHAWQTGEWIAFPKGSRGEQLLNIQFGPALQRRLRHVLALRAAGQETLLSVPTHTTGWLAPEVFAERFARLPRPLLDADELSAALYRLPALPEPRAIAWTRLASLVENRSEALDEAVALALAPDDRARRSLDWFLDRFARQPPNERLFQSLTSIDGSGLIETFRVKVLHHTPDTPENTAFRLFNAALRCRFGLDDAQIGGRASALAERLAPRAGWLSRVLQHPGADSSPFAKLLFAPRPVTETLADAVHTAAASVSFIYDTPYPFLWPYLLAHPQQFAAPGRVADLAYQFPPLAQRLFEAGLCRQGRKEDYYRDLTLKLLMQGRLPQVDIRTHLARAARSLAAAQPAQREVCVDLMAQWLNDGRMTPADGAITLAPLIRETGQGFVHLNQALASLRVTGPLGSATVLLALERAIGGGVAGFPPRKLSLILDQLSTVLEDTSYAVSEPAARNVLSTLATAKKSVSRDKANALLTRPLMTDQPPAWVLALAPPADE